MPDDTYTQREIDALRWDAHTAVHVADHEALRVALGSMDARLLLLNELKSAMADQAATYARIEWVDARLAALLDRITTLEKQAAQNTGRGSGSATTVAYIFAGLGALGSVVGIMLHFIR